MHINPAYLILIALILFKAYNGMGGYHRSIVIRAMGGGPAWLRFLDSPLILISVSAYVVFFPLTNSGLSPELHGLLLSWVTAVAIALSLLTLSASVMTRRLYPYLIMASPAAIAVALDCRTAAAVIMILSLLALQGYEWNMYRTWIAHRWEFMPGGLPSLLTTPEKHGDERVQEVRSYVAARVKSDPATRLFFGECGGAMTAMALLILYYVAAIVASKATTDSSLSPALAVVLWLMLLMSLFRNWTFTPSLVQPLQKRLVEYSLCRNTEEPTD